MKSSGKSCSIGSSVEPGLPNIVVIPWARKTSKEASRTLVTGADSMPPSGRRGAGSRRPSRRTVTSTGVTVAAELV